MHVGDQDVKITTENLQYLVRNGVTHIDALVGDGTRDAALLMDEAGFRAEIAKCAAEGVKLEMTHIVIPESITLGIETQRDVDIQQVCRCIEAAGRAGLRGLNYNFLVGAAYARTEQTEATIGRGGSSYSQFDLDRYDNSPPTMDNGRWSNGGAGVVKREEVYERARYFLERIMPIAEKYNVQMACHLNDPPAPVLRGVEQWNYPVFDGIKRFSELVDSPMHGFNFCCGTAAEGLVNPGVELYEIVAHFGRRKQLFNIHFRNVKGGLHDFQEVWPDEGDVNMFKLAQTLYSVGYPYMLMPDHAPSHPDHSVPEQPGKGVPFAFQFGYIIAVIQAVKIASLAGKPEVLNDLQAWNSTRTVTDSDSTPPQKPGKGSDAAEQISKL